MRDWMMSFWFGAVVGFVFAYVGQLFNFWVTGRFGAGGPTRFRARSHRPETPEGRIDNASRAVMPRWSKKTVAEGVRQLEGFYNDEGVPVPSAKELQRQAESMLNESFHGGAPVE